MASHRHRSRHPWRAWAALALLCLLATGAMAQRPRGGRDSTDYFLAQARTAQPAQALDLLDRALGAALSHGNVAGEATAYLALGQLHHAQGREAAAEESLLRARRSGSRPRPSYNTYSNTTYGASAPDESSLPPALRADIARALVAVYEAQRKWPQALAEADAWLLLMSGRAAITDMETMGRARGRLLSKAGQHEAALAQFQPLLAATRTRADHASESATLLEQGQARQRAGASGAARTDLEQALTIAKEHGLEPQALAATEALAQLHNATGNTAQELNALGERLNYVANGASPSSNYLANIELGNAYLSSDDLDMAQTYLDSGFQQLAAPQHCSADTATTVPSSILVPTTTTNTVSSTQLQLGADAYRQLTEGYLRRQNLEKALSNFQKYARMQDSVTAVHARELAEAVEMSKQMGLSEAKIQLLERERALAEQSIAVLEADRNVQGEQIFARNLLIGVLAGALVLGILVGLVLVRNMRARRRADKLLALQSMTGQMNPHFIFNALNSVNEFISQNDERAANRYLTAFSRLMRKVMDDSKQTLIPLADEVSMLRLYLELEHARFKHQFDYSLDVDEDLEASECLLPPMMVQPFIENAVWHGLRYREGKGYLDVHIALQDDKLRITVSDDGIGVERSRALKTAHQKKQHSMGMKNIAARIALMNELHDMGMSVQVSETHPGTPNPGTTVCLTIPQRQHLPSHPHSPETA